MDSYSDDELLYLTRCGNPDAQQCLYKRYYQEVSKWVLSFYRYHSQNIAYEDYVQIAMLNFSLLIDGYRHDQKASLKTFMKNAIMNRILSSLRVGKDARFFYQQTFVSLDDFIDSEDKMHYEEIVEDPSYSYRPEKQMIIRERETKYLADMLEKTSEKERTVMLYTHAGYQQQEIAEKLNISIKSVYNAIYRYHKKMLPIDERK